MADGRYGHWHKNICQDIKGLGVCLIRFLLKSHGNIRFANLEGRKFAFVFLLQLEYT